jgi:hypothetical protein
VALAGVAHEDEEDEEEEEDEAGVEEGSEERIRLPIIIAPRRSHSWIEDRTLPIRGSKYLICVQGMGNLRTIYTVADIDLCHQDSKWVVSCVRQRCRGARKAFSWTEVWHLV